MILEKTSLDTWCRLSTPTTITASECFPMWQKVMPRSSNLAKEIQSPVGGFGIICYLLAELFLKMAELFGATGRKPTYALTCMATVGRERGVSWLYVVLVICQNVCLSQNVQHLYIIILSSVMDSVHSTGVHLRPAQLSNLYPVYATNLHPYLQTLKTAVRHLTS